MTAFLIALCVLGALALSTLLAIHIGRCIPPSGSRASLHGETNTISGVQHHGA